MVAAQTAHVPRSTHVSDSKYDQAEARSLLDACGQAACPIVEERRKAGAALLGELLAAGKDLPGIAMDVPPGTSAVRVSMGDSRSGETRTVTVEVDVTGKVAVAGPRGCTEVPLDYDRAKDRLVGQGLDTTRKRAPGERHQRKDALVVMVEQIIRELTPVADRK